MLSYSCGFNPEYDDDSHIVAAIETHWNAAIEQLMAEDMAEFGHADEPSDWAIERRALKLAEAEARRMHA